VLDTLLEPFAYGFSTNAILAGAAVGGACAVLSCFLVLRGLALLGDGLVHAIVPGIVLAHLAALPLALGALLAGTAAVLSIEALGARLPRRRDAVIGVVYAGFFALGLLLISKFPAGIPLRTILFGNLLGIEAADVWQVVLLAILVALIVAALWHDLMLVSFDPRHAQAIGLPVRWLERLLQLLVVVAAVGGVMAVGVALVVAMLITPGAIAFLLVRGFRAMLALAGTIGAGTAGLGAYLAFFLDTSVSGLIVCLQTALFALALLHWRLRHAGSARPA
jgi:ABC-type Mn2+/Zn2+ transport system permease subunit